VQPDSVNKPPSGPASASNSPNARPIGEFDGTLEYIQRKAFHYFECEVNPLNGLIRDKVGPDDRDPTNWPSSIAAVGFALASYPVAVSRGFISREAAVKRSLATLRFFAGSAQSPESDATGYRGFYYHFLDMKTGQRAWACELSTVDTVLLIAGMLTCARFFTGKEPDEIEIGTLSDALYWRVEWDWALDRTSTLYMGWRPESGFLEPSWSGYNEALLLYILALGSPTHPIPQTSYQAWTLGYEWKRIYDIEYLYSAALFTHQFPHIWIDFRGIQDAYMREKGIDYFENSRRATHIQQRYAITNPMGFKGYSANGWGLSASEGPGFETVLIDGIERRFFGYISRGVPYGPDDGSLTPSAAASSLPFAPEIVLPAIHHFMNDPNFHDVNPYGFRATINPTHGEKNGPACGWISQWHFGINQGPVVLMTENHRSGLLWSLMRDCPYLIQGLRRAGFRSDRL